MKLSIGHRLFASVLLAILAVAACAVLLLRHNVLAGFGDYAVGIELDRLEELSGDLARRYRIRGGWDFVPDTDRRGWIAREIERLRMARADLPALSTVAEAPPAPPPLPPLPPVPPTPPLPPLPGPHIDAGVPTDDIAPLPSRVTLFDAAGRYLAGSPPGTPPPVRRAIVTGGRTIGYLGVARPVRPGDALAHAFLAQLSASLWWIVLLALLLSALAATLLARHFRRPIRDLTQGTRQLADGDYALRLDEERSDELGDLARHVNALALKLAGAEAARRQWVADTSHELRTPLAVLRAQLEALQDGVRSATPDNVAAMLRQVLALNTLVDGLYALARADVGALDCRREPLDLWQLATEGARAFAGRFDGAGLALELGPAPSAARVLADPDRMRQVFDNLFENSLRYTAAGGRVHLHGLLEDGVLQLHLDDSAPGVPDAALARLAERFYRVDASRSRAHGGAGLGLALSARLLEAQGARLHFAHSPLGGLRATIAFPLAAHPEGGA